MTDDRDLWRHLLKNRARIDQTVARLADPVNQGRTTEMGSDFLRFLQVARDGQNIIALSCPPGGDPEPRTRTERDKFCWFSESGAGMVLDLEDVQLIGDIFAVGFTRVMEAMEGEDDDPRSP